MQLFVVTARKEGSSRTNKLMRVNTRGNLGFSSSFPALPFDYWVFLMQRKSEQNYTLNMGCDVTDSTFRFRNCFGGRVGMGEGGGGRLHPRPTKE